VSDCFRIIDSGLVFEDEFEENEYLEDQAVGDSLRKSSEDTHYYRDNAYLPEIWDDWS